MQYLFNLKVCRCDSKKEGGASGRRRSKSLRRIHFLALAIAYKIQLKDTIERYNCGAPQHEGRCQKPLTLFGAGYLLPPSRQGAGVGATFALMSLFNNKTQNILALMYVFIVSCS